MASSNKANFHRFDNGLTGVQGQRTHEDIHNVKRIDDDWPEDEFGAKVFLAPSYGELLERMGSGDITMRTDGEPVDPPREPEPGSPEFGYRARDRRDRLRREAAGERPIDPEDVEIRDEVSGKSTSLKNRRKELEDAGNF